MPARKSPADWKLRTVTLLRAASKLGTVRRAAAHVGEKREPLIQDTIALAEAAHVDLMGPKRMNSVSYNEACRVAADRLEAS